MVDAHWWIGIVKPGVAKTGLTLGATLTLPAGATPATPAGTARADSIRAPVLESKITLDHVHGRIDHLAVDIARQRLYVAELGNDTVGVVDLKNHAVTSTLRGFHEPQGVGYEPTTDTLYVANGGDGTVDLFQGADLTPIGKITLGDDADNVRVDPTTHRVIVGYGSGALAVIDPVSRKRIAVIRLKGHPESFQMDRSGEHIFVNVPNSGEIAVVDVNQNQQAASWTPAGLHANFPLAIDESHHRVLTVFRHPSKLGVFNAEDGTLVSSVDTCGDADDVFVDPKRSLVYVICGEGVIDVLVAQGNSYVKSTQTATIGGARTALFVPDIDRLFLAVRATLSEPAAIWVYRPGM
jgi:DNA-binding beta-propeller fold protein YncE